MLIALSAPYQCASDDQRPPVEDSAPEALWILAERFKAENNLPARETTLRQIVDAYPSSRYAQRARHELGIPDPTPAQ
jgi:TolA-binding protein